MLRAYLDGELFAERVGDGRPRVIGLHGWARSGADLLGVLEGTVAIAPDLPGFGATPPPTEPWGAHDYARVVARLIEAEAGGDPVVVLGHSFGGRVAVCLGANHPELVRALVLTGVPLLRPPGAGPTRSPWRYRLVKRLATAGLVGERALENARHRYGSADYRAATGVLRDTLVRLVNETYEDELAGLVCPVELVWGSQDTAAPLSVAEAVAARLPNARLTVVHGADHDGPLRRPVELHAAIARQMRTTP